MYFTVLFIALILIIFLPNGIPYIVNNDPIFLFGLTLIAAISGGLAVTFITLLIEFKNNVKRSNESFGDISKDIVEKPKFYCKICYSLLDSYKYPDNFPNEYKICCKCKETADRIYDMEQYKNLELQKFLNYLNGLDVDYLELFTNISLTKLRHYLIHKERFDNLFIYRRKKEM